MKLILLSIAPEYGYNVAKELSAVNDDIQIAPVFTTDLNLKGHISENFMYYMPSLDVELSYKNNAFMWVHSDAFGSKGMTMADMYNADIFVMDFAQFNNMSKPVLDELRNNDDAVIVFMDQKQIATESKKMAYEGRFALERVYEGKYMYFCTDDYKEIASVIIKYIGGDEQQRAKILRDNY